ncbi:MAG: tRNA glutamyl-Q(34) synthetase GluQRS [Planctomycetota bacterium]
MQITRLAPSPTGALHLGNARTFLINRALARQSDWQVLMRIEDLDGPRIKAGASEHAIETLRWLGLDWDGDPVYQSEDLSLYREALEQLIDAGLAYPCRCTRSQILAASRSAPNAGDHELRYPGTCRPKRGEQIDASLLDDPTVSWRFIAADTAIPFDDAFAGPQSFNPQREVGDFLVATKDCQPSYQLAVVVDDARQGMTQIVRGDDLLSCTSRQLLLYRALGLGPEPTYTHLPLVVGEDGRRLAKRHGDTRVSHYRDLGVSPERVIGLLARWCGIDDADELTTTEFVERFDITRLAAEQVVFSAADDAWLRA